MITFKKNNKVVMIENDDGKLDFIDEELKESFEPKDVDKNKKS